MEHNLKYLRIVILSLVFSLVSLQVNAQKQSYIQTNKTLAEKLSTKYGIPSSVILAIAFVETGGGTSRNSKSLNNHFGIVGKNNIGSKYKQFESKEESYEAFCKLVVKKNYYSALKGTEDFGKWVKAMASAGYSTQPSEWMKRINSIIQKYQLKD
ncbi:MULTISPECIES: glucosaminidase domain-containing protein [Chryseobacterium]|nr:glucosaminidase domain-containing protein [Chryseobacterium piscicola]PQA91861.1 muramidase [Chryseobacterium piscicola]